MFKYCKTLTMVLVAVVLISACTPSDKITPVPIDPQAVSNSRTTFVITDQVERTSLAVQMEKITDLERTGSLINTLFFSPEGRTLITGDWNGEVIFWDRDSWKQSNFLQPLIDSTYDSMDRYGTTMAQTPDGGTTVVALRENGKVNGYDLNGRELFIYNYGSHVYALAISPDGKLLAVGGDKNLIAIYDLVSMHLVTELTSDHECITSMVFSPNGKTLAAGYDLPGNVIKLWDTTSWKETGTFADPGVATDYHDIIFSPDGKLMAYAVRDGIEIKIVDLATMEIVMQTGDLTRPPYEITFSPDGLLLASAGDDFTFRLWDMNAGKFIKTMHTGHEVGTVAFSPDGTLIAFSVWDEGVEVWRITY